MKHPAHNYTCINLYKSATIRGGGVMQHSVIKYKGEGISHESVANISQ